MTDAAELLARITATVDYLRVSVGPHDHGWIGCETLLAEPDRLGELVQSTKAGRGTDRDDVAMSLFVQGYSFRIASLAIGGWVLGDAVIDLAPTRTSIALGRDRPNAVAVDDARVLTVGEPLTALHEALIESHLARLVRAAHAACLVGEPLLWGNVAASCASSFGAFAGELSDRRVEIRDRAEAFFASAPPPLTEAGCLVRLGERWAWERKSCCLWHLTDAGFRCEDCSLWTDEERRRRYAANEAGR
ncbi:MAG: IucA/IucC family C-terminal-domain containing protein [Acidimicrobiia bacterium]